jgi:hypothetical protein
MDTDVRAVRTAGILSGTLVPNRTRLKGLQVTATGAGQLELRDGFSLAGPVKLLIDVAAGMSDIIIPGGGVLFETAIFATSSGAFVSANVFIG